MRSVASVTFTVIVCVTEDIAGVALPDGSGNSSLGIRKQVEHGDNLDEQIHGSFIELVNEADRNPGSDPCIVFAGNKFDPAADTVIQSDQSPFDGEQVVVVENEITVKVERTGAGKRPGHASIEGCRRARPELEAETARFTEDDADSEFAALGERYP